MGKYVLRRLIISALMVLAVATIIFFMIHLVPGDPATLVLGEGNFTPEQLAMVRKALGLDRPLHVQYFTWLGGLLRGDMGNSLVTGRPITLDMGLRLPRTFELIGFAVVLAVAMGVPLGIIAARRANTWMDLFVSSAALMGVVTPVFVTGTLLVLLLSIEVSLLPSSGWVSVTGDFGGHFKRVVMPVVVLAFSMAAVIMRMTRSSMLEVIRQDYIRTARAKGLAELAVLYGHALKNALIPVVTVVGVQMGNLLGGMVIVEQVFAWPGVSTFLIDGIARRDYPVVQSVVLVISLTFVLINLVVDLLYGYLDPRIKYQ